MPEPGTILPLFADPAVMRDQARALLVFYLPRSLDREIGGFASGIDDDGTVYDRRTRHLVHSCRYPLGFALGHRFGLLPGDQGRGAAEHGLNFLWEAHRDPINGGFWWVLDGRDPTDRRKFAYGHAFVLLAAATAIRAGIAVHDLLDEAWELLESRFWREADGLYVDEISEDWSSVDPYRAQNANMHLTEALLAAHAATGEIAYLDRAAAVAERVVVDLAGQSGGLLHEHYDAAWRVDLTYHRETPRDLFRPYGVLPGHLLEWAKLLVLLDRERPTAWALPTARRWFDQAIDRAWDDERGGFAYAVEADGAVIDAARYHWVIAEAIGAAVALHVQTGDQRYRDWIERFWRYAWTHQIDHVHGGWFAALTQDGQRERLAFARGKGDFYHPLGACLLASELTDGL